MSIFVNQIASILQKLPKHAIPKVAESILDAFGVHTGHSGGQGNFPLVTPPLAYPPGGVGSGWPLEFRKSGWPLKSGSGPSPRGR